MHQLARRLFYICCPWTDVLSQPKVNYNTMYNVQMLDQKTELLQWRQMINIQQLHITHILVKTAT